MSTNDALLLDQLVIQQHASVGNGLSSDEFFEFFAAEQILKDDDLSYEEIADGIVDGGGDGGVDSCFFFINNKLYNDDFDIESQRKGAQLRLVMIQSKNTTGFGEGGIEKFVSSARDFFDLTKNIGELYSVYNKDILDKISIFREVYVGLTSKFPSITVCYYYATKGIDIHQNVSRKVDHLKETICSLFNPVSFNFKFINASDLLLMSRKIQSTSSTLKLAENPISTNQEGFVGLATLKDYIDFITNEESHLKSYLFEGNVRDYQGNTAVNSEIQQTLRTEQSEDFWWLNNGVTIICSKASCSGKILSIEDAEIVNGLQTSREIFNAFYEQKIINDQRNLLIRVLKPQSQENRDNIIKATNSQTPISAASLRATDKIHRDIEDFLSSRGFFYDRRKNYYKNSGKPIKKIWGIPFMAQSVMACALFDPANARARPSSLIKSNDAYLKIFNEKYPLELYYKCPIIVQTSVEAIKQSDNEDHKKHANNIVFYVASLFTLHISKIPNPNINQVANIDTSSVTIDNIRQVIPQVWDAYLQFGGNDQAAKGTELRRTILEKKREEILQLLKTKTDTN